MMVALLAGVTDDWFCTGALLHAVVLEDRLMRGPAPVGVAAAVALLLLVGVLVGRATMTDGIRAGRKVYPVVPEARLVAPTCPQQGVPEGRAPTGFTPVRVWRCLEGRTETTSWTPDVQAVLDGPDAVLWFGDAPCPAVALSPLQLWVVDAGGRGYRPRVPGDYCFQHSFEGTRFFAALPWRGS